MQITVTVNSDRRYYLDGPFVSGADSLVETVRRFNVMKIALYNELYDRDILKKEDCTLKSESYSAFLKRLAREMGWASEKDPLSDYYTRAVYSASNGALRAQKEQKELHKETASEKLDECYGKAKEEQESLDKLLSVKASLKAFLNGKGWTPPYEDCGLTVEEDGRMARDGKTVNAVSFERKIDEKIRAQKNKVRNIEARYVRLRDKLDDLIEKPVRRIVFGSKKFYSQKDKAASPEEMDRWKEGFRQARYHAMCLPGMSTSKDANFLVKKTGDGLHVRCLDGQEAVFRDFNLTRYEEEYEAQIHAVKAERRPVAYTFTLHEDREGKAYIRVSVTMTLVNARTNYGFSDGCVSMDMNWDNICLSDISAKGGLIERKVIPFRLEGKTSGQVDDILGRVMRQAGDYCSGRKKCLVIEDVDTTVSKSGMHYGSKKGNRHASLFASRKITAGAMNQGYRQGFEVYKVNPAYTSLAGKVLFMSRMGCSIHEAASYCIGLKGMGLWERFLPRWLINALPDRKRPEKKDFAGFLDTWKYIKKETDGIRVHAFYIPERKVTRDAKKKGCTLPAALKERDDRNYYRQKHRKAGPVKAKKDAGRVPGNKDMPWFPVGDEPENLPFA
mgnify:CR=1 FL=1